jgi:soluble lytic murein transglycosylase
MSTRRATVRAAPRSQPRSAPARSRPVSRRRARRRRLVAALAAVGVVGIASVVLYPMLHHAVREITLPLRHEDIIRQQATSKHLDPALIAAVIYAESKFNPRDSTTGAKGLMQIQPATARFIAHRSGGTEFQIADLAEPQVNISYGSYYLRYLLDRYDGNATLAVAAYNGGETNVDQWISDSGRGRAGFRGQDIPFAETRAYVERVMDARRDYRSTYARELGL